MKKKLLCTLTALVIALSMMAGCSAAPKSDSEKSIKGNYLMAETADEIDGDYYSNEAAYISDDLEAAVSMDYTDDTVGDLGNNLKKVSPEMLVYRCTLGIDTTEFDKTLSSLREKIKEYGGFVESETLSDNCYNSGNYIVSKDDRLRRFSATIRIPSDKYADFVGCAEGLGIVNSKNAYVDDVTQKYGTLSTTLAIYEADYNMYLEQYENTTDESARILLQQELRELAIEIADIKTSMSSIENDVAYSYVTISIDEYLVIPEPELEPEPEPEPTFGERLKNEMKESWENFLSFAEGLLFFVIDTWWGFLIFAIVVVVTILIIRLIIKIVKNANAKAKIKREIKAEEYRKKIEEQNKKSISDINSANTKAPEVTKTEETDKK